MANIGKILIMPKGNYDASVSYEILDMVNHNGSTWVAKRDAIGIEPSDAHSEYWFKMVNNSDVENIVNGTTPVGDANKLGGKDASEYAVLGENNYSGALKIATDKESLVGFTAKNALREVRLYANNTGKIQLYDATNGKAIIASETDGTNTFNGTANGNLPLSGGTVDGNVELKSTSAVGRKVVLENSKRRITLEVDTTGTCYLWDATNNKALGTFPLDGTNTFNGTASENLGINAYNSVTKNGNLLTELCIFGKTVHHDGNSAKVAIQSSAPTDTSSLWVW